MPTQSYNAGIQLLRASDGILIPALGSDNGVVTIIEAADIAINLGLAYTVSSYFPAIANNDSADVVLTPGKDIHIVMALAASAEVLLRLFVGTVSSADGTLIIPRNRKHASLNTSTAVFREDPTISDDGLETQVVLVPGGGVFGSGGETGLLGTKLILAAGQSYLLRIENTSGGAVRSTFQLLFFEEAA